MSSVDIESLVNKFENALRGHKGPKTLDVTLGYFKEIVSSVISEIGSSGDSAKVGKKSVSKSKVEDGEKKLPSTWNRIITSKDWGLKSRFPDDYDRIKKESGATSFQILSLLRTELEGEPERLRWNEYISWVQENLSSAPSDPPSDRKPKEVKVSSKVSKPAVRGKKALKSEDVSSD